MLVSKYLIAFIAGYGGLGGILFDAVIPATARQHLWNPAWPPHAKFHNGQTMLMGVCNAIATLFVLFVLPLTFASLLLAAALAATYFICMLLAPNFPGTAWSDPEFAASNPKPLGLPVQKFLSLMAVGVVAVAVLTAI